MKSSVFKGTAKIHKHFEDIQTLIDNIDQLLDRQKFCTFVTDAHTIAEWQDRLICEGKGYYYSDYSLYTNQQTINWIFNPTAYPGQYYFFILPSFSATGGPVLVDFFLNPIYTGGTPQQVNSLKSDAIPAVSQVLKGVTINTPGFRVSGRLIPAGTQGVVTTPSEAQTRQLTIFEKFLIPHLQVRNTVVQSVYVQIDFVWFEI